MMNIEDRIELIKCTLDKLKVAQHNQDGDEMMLQEEALRQLGVTIDNEVLWEEE